MKILVLCAQYPSSDGLYGGMFYHARNKDYLESGYAVTVINFTATEDYIIEDIPVYTMKTYEKKLINESYDLLVCHAPGITYHYKFLKQYDSKFDKIVFFFHGNEVLKYNVMNANQYHYMENSNWFSKVKRNSSDNLKLILWKRYYTKIAYKSHFVFVSEWMREEFLKWTKIPHQIIENRNSIIYNCVGSSFELSNYNPNTKKEFDFVSIRGSLDGSKYGIDIINELAKNNLKYKFVVVGKGEFFRHFKKADNITWINEVLNHKEIIDLINKCRCGIMPTRLDAQGLMMCEMATFGIPVITSDIPVCKEVLGDFENVEFINNKNTSLNLKTKYEDLLNRVPYKKNTRYFRKNTSQKELQLFIRVVGEK